MHKLESVDNPYVKHLYKLVNESVYRHKMNKVLIEGKELIMELLPYLNVGTLYAEGLWQEQALQKVTISKRIATKISSLKDENAVFAEVPLPKLPFPSSPKKLLALDGISDPGNLGTILRTALALKWEGVILLPGTCDPFNAKVIRASKGALFKLPYIKGSWDDIDRLKMNVLVADLKGAHPEAFKNEKCVLILGNEGQGVSLEAKSRGKQVTIPMRGEMESLNVAAAGAILMYILGES